MYFFLDLLVLTCNISIETCAYVLLSWYALRGEALRPPPCTPPPAFIFKRLPLLPTIPFFLHKHHRLFGSVNFIFVDIHRDLCLCASFLIFSFLLAIYPLRLVPMCFSLGTHCGGRRCALPPAPPHPLLFLNRLPLLPTIPLFFHKHHPLFGLISSLLISIKTCAYVLLSGYALRGEALRPPPCTPPPAFIF